VPFKAMLPSVSACDDEQRAVHRPSPDHNQREGDVLDLQIEPRNSLCDVGGCSIIIHGHYAPDSGAMVVDTAIYSRQLPGDMASISTLFVEKKLEEHILSGI
jgi:hypothetical protein